MYPTKTTHTKPSSVILILPVLLICLISNCKSTTPLYPSLPKHYEQTGLVTSNTYQIHLVVTAENMTEATRVAIPKARTKAFQLIIKEPSLHFSISSYGKTKIKKLVKKNGTVVYAIPQSEESWIVVFQVYKKGLWDYLRTIY